MLMKVENMSNAQMSGNAEHDFMQAVQHAQLTKLDVGAQVQALEQWLAALLKQLQGPLIQWATCLTNESALAQSLLAIQEAIQSYPEQWSAKWDELKPALNMADRFADKLMFLVFGKFNAGKSSFCNLLVDRFVAQGLPAEYFVLESGEIQSSPGPFKEGTTETTAHIQGAILANRLVFIDTPGLHSVTQENADLTQRFLDSADAVLWLSSSTSPGQVQELEELALEIRRCKPLLPIITRSDFLDEDIVDNQIVNVLCNKSDENRAIQESDVLSRAQDKLMQMGLDASLIQTPLSISAYAARSHGLTEQALEEGGVYRFYHAITQLIPPLLAYKAKKPLAMYLHHLEENVSSDVLVSCQDLANYAMDLKAERHRVQETTAQLSESIWREIVSHILRLLDGYFAVADEGLGTNRNDASEGEAIGAEVSTGRSEAARLSDLQQGLIEAMTQEYQTQIEQVLGIQYRLPNHLFNASEFRAPLIEAYFAPSKALRADDFEKIYLSLENLVAKQIQEHLQHLQQFVDTELAQLEKTATLTHEQLQQSLTELQAKKEAWV